eukprot:c24148_g1_i3 orf=239-4345(+)
MMEPSELQTVEHAGKGGHQNKDKHLKSPGYEPATEFSSSDCLQPESAIEVLNEEFFDDKSDLDEEHTPEKAIIQSDFHDLKKFKHSQSDNDSSCSSYGTQVLENRSEKLQDGPQKHRMVKHVAATEEDHHQAKAISIRLPNEVWQENRTEASLVQMLWRQMGNLALKEKEVEQTLSIERIENLVSKVEEEVEFEGMVEDLCSRFKAEGEFMDIERRERDWERERREVRLEEELELLRNKVVALEEEIRIAHAERDCAFQKQTERHELIHSMQISLGAGQCQQSSGSHADSQIDDEKILTVVKGHQELLDEGGESLLAALREMLCQAEEKAERDRRMLEDTFQDEQQLWIENEQLLQNRISTLEKELNCMRDTLKEKESVISSERDRRRHYGLEVDKVLAFCRDENSVHNDVLQRLKSIEGFLATLAGRIKHLMTLHPAGETEAEGLFLELLMDLEKVENEKLERGSSESQQRFDWELVELWKSQRDLLEEERDKLQEKLESTTEMARENEERMERVWEEKEMKLVEQLSNLEALVGNEDVVWNQTNVTALREKGLCECDVAAYKQAWKEEREKVQEMMAEREQWMEEHTHEWSAVLDIKEEEMCALKSAQKKLGNSLTTSKKRLLNLKRQLARHRRGTAKDSSMIVYRINSNFDNNRGLCSDESDLDTSCSTDLSTSKELSRAADGDEEYYMDVEQLANDISKEIGRLAREIRQEQDRLERERTDVRIGTQQLKDERKELEKKVADALSLMEDLKKQIKAKEGQIERERKQMDLILNSKTDEVEHLKTLLNSKDHEIERIVQKFKEELNLIQKEVEKERKEREDVMDMHFSSRRKLVQEMKEKEVRWEKEIEAMSQETEQLRIDIDEKNKLISKLKKELRDFDLDAKEKSFKQDGRFTQEIASEDMPKALINYVRTGPELTASGSTQGIGFHGRRDVEWQDVIGKIAGFDKQIAEAMLAIQSLKEELNAKEKELQRARLERDSERKAGWIHEQVETKDPQENSRIIETQSETDWGEREHLLLTDDEDLGKLLEAERADTADAMSILQGAVRELQWSLKHYKREDVTSFELDREAQSFSTKGELVKVHASHLEELDGYILDLKMKVEEAEKRARTAEVALAVNTVKEAAKRTGTASALVKVGNEWMVNNQSRRQGECTPARIGRSSGGADLGSQCFQSPVRRQSENGRQGSDVLGTNLRNIQQDQRWSGGTSENAQLWDLGISSPGLDASSNSSSSGWMTVRGGADDNFVMQDPFQQGPLTLAVSTPPPRSQRRWLVDAFWLENVRKEQTLLKQQLDIERQRVSALKQVEMENRWMEATVVQALEQKKDSDTRVLELERKVAFLESMISKKGGREKSPISSSFYRSAKS